MAGLNYVSWADNTGYAVAAKAYVRALAERGVDLTWTPMLPGAAGYKVRTAAAWPCPILGPVCNREIAYDTILVHTVPEYYPPWIEKARAEGRRILGYTVWELDRLPGHWPGILNALDGVIVPCRWNVEVFRNSGVTVPIHAVPHLSQFDHVEADGAALQSRIGGPGIHEGRFVFYTIGFWSHRKAPYLAVEAYLEAFTADDPVVMIVKTSDKDITRWHRHWRNGFRRRHPSPGKTLEDLVARYRNPAPIISIAEESLSDGEMLALHEMGDCFVSLARAEGWGLGAFEAARLGRPVVTTGYGGQRDFLDPALAYLVDHAMVPVHEPTWSDNYGPTDLWAEPSVSQAARYLHDILADPAAARGRARRLAQRIAADFSRTAVTDALLGALA